MDTSALGKLFWILAILCGAYLWASKKAPEQIAQLPAQVAAPKQQSQNNYPQFIAAYQKVKQAKDDDSRLSAIEQALLIAVQEGYSDKKVLAGLHVEAAKIHHGRWHYQHAVSSLEAALELDFNPQLDKQRLELQRYIVSNDGERESKFHYLMTPQSGPAKSLSGKVLVAYVFVDDGLRTRWSDKTIRRTGEILKKVEQWNQQQAANYPVAAPEFINKTFMVQRNPNLRALKALDHNSKRVDIDRFVSVVMQHLGAGSVGDFIQKEMAAVGADQGAIIFHSNFNQRSFARRCGFTHQRVWYDNGQRHVENISRCQEEYVMLMNKVERNRWEKLQYTQAHELLHLFGADDLYNISQAKNFAVTDIMNYHSRYLRYSEVSPITAYAIGWQQSKPDTPFEVVIR